MMKSNRVRVMIVRRTSNSPVRVAFATSRSGVFLRIVRRTPATVTDVHRRRAISHLAGCPSGDRLTIALARRLTTESKPELFCVDACVITWSRVPSRVSIHCGSNPLGSGYTYEANRSREQRSSDRPRPSPGDLAERGGEVLGL